MPTSQILCCCKSGGGNFVLWQNMLYATLLSDEIMVLLPITLQHASENILPALVKVKIVCQVNISWLATVQIIWCHSYHVMILNMSWMFVGEGGIPAGWTQGAGESQTRPRQAYQDARVCTETGKVSETFAVLAMTVRIVLYLASLLATEVNLLCGHVIFMMADWCHLKKN